MNKIYATLDLNKSVKEFKENVTKILELSDVDEYFGTKFHVNMKQLTFINLVPRKSSKSKFNKIFEIYAQTNPRVQKIEGKHTTVTSNKSKVFSFETTVCDFVCIFR